jgi:hypothetical protein
VGVTLSGGVFFRIIEVFFEDKLKKAILFRSNDHDINLLKDDFVAHFANINYERITKSSDLKYES